MPGQHSALGRYLFFGLASLGLLMSSINMTIVAVALPSMTRSLDTSLSWVGWTLTAYQLVQVIVMPLAGRLSDGLGRKRVFLFCVACFTLGSALSGLAPNIGWLIFFRAIQAIGGGGLMPSAVGIVSDQFKERRSQAIGMFTSIMPIGTIIGPNLGGWMLEHWTWRELFFVNVPVGLVTLVGAQVLLRDSRQPGRVQGIDLPGLALFAAGMLGFMYALTWAGNDPGTWRTAPFWLLLAGSAGLFGAFIRQERRAAQPVVDLALVAHRPFLPAHLYNLLFGGCVFGTMSFIPYYAVVQYGMSPALSGAVLTPRALVVIGASAATSLLLLRLGYRLPMLAGMGFTTASLILMSFGWTHVTLGPFAVDDFWLLALESALTGVGIGLSSPAANNASIDLAPDKAAAISGLRGMFRQSGGIIGISSIVLALSFFDDKAAGLRASFLVLALVLQMAIPLTLMIPEAAHRRRRGGESPSAAPVH
ncbi:MAG: MFS transporter [Chloroflexi bacterium]|nr:MFS transporter [Chloroflexota bacterium]